MSPQHNESPFPCGSFPRVSGDEPWSVVIFMNFPVFSPRERG